MPDKPQAKDTSNYCSHHEQCQFIHKWNDFYKCKSYNWYFLGYFKVFLLKFVKIYVLFMERLLSFTKRWENLKKNVKNVTRI